MDVKVTNQPNSRSGLFVYTVLNGLIAFVIFVSGGRIEPREYDLKEYWTWKGTGRPPWFVRALCANHRSNIEVEESQHELNEHGPNDDSFLDSQARSSTKEDAMMPMDRPILSADEPISSRVPPH